MSDDLKLTGAIKKTRMIRWIKVKLLRLTLRGQCTEALVQLIRLQLFQVLILILKDLLEVSHLISSLFSCMSAVILSAVVLRVHLGEAGVHESMDLLLFLPLV